MTIWHILQCGFLRHFGSNMTCSCHTGPLILEVCVWSWIEMFMYVSGMCTCVVPSVVCPTEWNIWVVIFEDFAPNVSFYILGVTVYYWNSGLFPGKFNMALSRMGQGGWGFRKKDGGTLVTLLQVLMWHRVQEITSIWGKALNSFHSKMN